MTDYNQPCSDVVDFDDTYARTVVYERTIEEGGLLPNLVLEPSDTRTPLAALTINDSYSNEPGKGLADAFTMASDVVGPFAIGKGAGESVLVVDVITKSFVKSLEEAGMVPALDLYPSGILTPKGSFAIYDIVGSGFYTLLLDTLNITDGLDHVGIGRLFAESVGVSDSTIKGVSKYIEEIGLMPSITVYPSETLTPYSGIQVTDIVGAGFGRMLEDAFGVTDLSANAVMKDLSENIGMLDSILIGFRLYFSENAGILDTISKGKGITMTESFGIVDAVVKSSVQLLSESMAIDDSMEDTLRTLVRASLRAISAGNCSVSAM